MIRVGGNGRLCGVGQRDHPRSGTLGEGHGVDNALGIAREADGNHDVPGSDIHDLLEQLTAGGGFNEADVVENHAQVVV